MAALEIFSARAMLIFGAPWQSPGSQVTGQTSIFKFRCSRRILSSLSCLVPLAGKSGYLGIYLGDKKLAFVDVELLSRLQGKTQASQISWFLKAVGNAPHCRHTTHTHDGKPGPPAAPPASACTAVGETAGSGSRKSRLGTELGTCTGAGPGIGTGLGALSPNSP